MFSFVCVLLERKNSAWRAPRRFFQRGSMGRHLSSLQLSQVIMFWSNVDLERVGPPPEGPPEMSDKRGKKKNVTATERLQSEERKK